MRHRPTRRGVTLLEILVVIVIFSMLLGMTVVVLKNANKDLGVRAAAAQVVSLLRAVSEKARSDASPAWVVMNTQENSIFAITKETVGMFHFEDQTGAFNQNYKVNSAVQVPGRVGLCYRFRSGQTIELPEIPQRRDNQGVAIEFWFYRAPVGSKHVLCTVGKDIEIACDASGRVTAKIGKQTINSDTYQVPRESWVYLQLLYNQREMKLLLNDVEVKAQAGSTTWKTGIVTLGSMKDGLAGLIDEVRLSLILSGDLYSLPGQVSFELTPPARATENEFLISFTGLGRLEARHGAAVAFKIKSATDEKAVTINQQGLIQR